MKRLSTALLAAALFTASTLWAELKYISYDLANPTADPVAVPVEDIKEAEYHTGSKMLFVQNTAVSEEYYIGAFEVTVAQAERLGWLTTTSNSGVAYATATDGPDYNFGTQHSLAGFSRLTFPSVAQWSAYTGTPAQPCNVYWGRESFPRGPFSLSVWYETYFLKNKEVKVNAYGVFDIFGNVAEYAVGEGVDAYGQPTVTHLFYGGFAHGNCTYDSLVSNGVITHATAAAITTITGSGDPRLGARLIYTPPEAQKYTVTVTLNGDPVGTPISAKENDSVSFDEPNLPFGHDLVSRTVTPELEISGTSFTMPAQNVTIAYVTAPYLTLTVSGGTATETKVFKGDTVTLTPAPGNYQRFNSWSSPEDPESNITEVLSEDGTLTLTVEAIADTEAGTALTYTATFDTCPRVLVYSGTAEVNAAGTAYGEGYYAPGSILTLTASDVPGYKLTGWTIKTDGTTTLSGNTVTVGSYNTDDAVLSPVYATGPVVNPEVTRIGEEATASENDTVYSAKTVLGYKAGTTTEYTVDGNTFVHYDTELRTEPYVSFNTETVSIDYSDSEPTGSKTTAPTLKRVALDGAQPYYVGIYETTVAHTANLAKALDSKAEVTESDLKDIDPQIYKNGTAAHHTTYFANIKTLFGVEVSLPTVAQIEGITKAGLGTDEDGNPEIYAGTGYKADPKITADMVLHHNNHPKTTDGLTNTNPTALNYQEVGKMTVDPYGFYDLWGNVLEMMANGELIGGHCNSNPNSCNLTVTDSYPSNFPGAFRPAVTVPKKLSVTIEGINEPFTVLPDQKILLAPQMKAGKTFTGWQATVGGTTTDIAKDTGTGRYPYTVTKDVELTPVFSEEVPMITLAYTNCTGPEKALPGSTTAVYATTPGYKLLSLTVTPAAAAEEINVAAGTVTFAAEATGAVTVTATYDIPAKPGYRFGLR